MRAHINESLTHIHIFKRVFNVFYSRDKRKKCFLIATSEKSVFVVTTRENCVLFNSDARKEIFL